MKVLLLQLDGKNPNVALMRLSAHHRARGDEITFRWASNYRALEPHIGEHFDQVYASMIFERTKPLGWRLLQVYQSAIIGGSGWDEDLKVEDVGVTSLAQDYSLYPHYRHSIGYLQRGCRFNCEEFCKVPVMEPGGVREENSIESLYRAGQSYTDRATGDIRPCPKELVLLDNDFFGSAKWREKIRQIREGGFRVSFNQGINVRALSDAAAEAVASVDYYDDDFKRRRVYTAWDSRGDEAVVLRGLARLVKYGVKPDNIMVYMLIGKWEGETEADREYRRARLREFGCRPYPMPFVRTKELVGFQRWVVGAYDKRVSWARWKAAGYQPANLGLDTGQLSLLNEEVSRGRDDGIDQGGGA